MHCVNSKLIQIHHLDENVWILISWLHQKPADLDLHLFTKGGITFRKKCYVYSALIKLIMALKLRLKVVLTGLEFCVAKRRLSNFEKSSSLGALVLDGVWYIT